MSRGAGECEGEGIKSKEAAKELETVAGHYCSRTRRRPCLPCPLPHTFRVQNHKLPTLPPQYAAMK